MGKILIKLTTYKGFIALLSLLGLASIIFFFRLDQLPIRMWDESRLAVNALEMAFNGNWLVTYFDGEPDLWNTKPPLLIWVIFLCMKILGYNEWAVRLPSAMCGMMTVLLLFGFGYIYLKDLKIGISAALVLLTSFGFIGEHVARTGDYDAMLTLWVTLCALASFLFFHHQEWKEIVPETTQKWSLTLPESGYLWIAAYSCLLAILTKSLAGIMPLLGIVIYAAFQGKLGKLLRSPHTYVAGVTVLITIAAYYLFREHYNPGYLGAVVKNELSRSSQTIEGHIGPAWMYLGGFRSKLIPWLYFIPICFVITQISEQKLIRKFGLFSIFYMGWYLLIISASKTKLSWYDAPLYPIAALVVAIGIAEIMNVWLKKAPQIVWKYYLAVLIVLICLFTIPYFNTFYWVYKQQATLYSSPNDPPFMYKSYFKQLTDYDPNLIKFSAVYDEYNASLIFYAKLKNQTNYSIKTAEANQAFQLDEIIVTCEANALSVLEHRYVLNTLHSQPPCKTLQVMGDQ